VGPVLHRPDAGRVRRAVPHP